MAFAALARNVDLLNGEDNRAKVLTVHQAKGLEFDLVVIVDWRKTSFNYGAKKGGAGRTAGLLWR